MTDPWYVSAFGAHYSLLYAHRDEQEARECLALLPRLAPLVLAGPAGALPILDLGCGDGRHLQVLREQGAPVLGLDLSPVLLKAARARLRDRAPDAAPALIRADMARLPLVGAALGAVLSLFTAFGYFGPLEANEPVVAEVSRALALGGHWFLDYFDGDHVRRELSGARGSLERRRELGPCRVTESRSLTLDGRIVAKQVDLVPLPGQEAAAGDLGIGPGGLRYREQVALFPLADLDDLAARNGLFRVAQAGSYRGAELGMGDRWLLVYRKRDPAPEVSW